MEATYEGPEAVQRRQLSITMTNALFLAQFRQWISQMRHLAGERPGMGACTLAAAMELWDWTFQHLLQAVDADGKKLYRDQRQGVTFPMTDALCWMLAVREMILDVQQLEQQGGGNPALADALPGTVQFYSDLCHVQAARAAGEVGRICAELVFGYNRHPSPEAQDRCCHGAAPDELEAGAPGTVASGHSDVGETASGHSCEDGCCTRFPGYEAFARLRARLDGCLTGSRLAKDRAAAAVGQVMIPEALDYPQ